MKGEILPVEDRGLEIWTRCHDPPPPLWMTGTHRVGLVAKGEMTGGGTMNEMNTLEGMWVDRWDYVAGRSVCTGGGGTVRSMAQGLNCIGNP